MPDADAIIVSPLPAEQVLETTEAYRSGVTSERPHKENRQRQQAQARLAIEDLELKYGAAHVIHLFAPVSICMGAVIITMLTVGYFNVHDEDHTFIYTPFQPKASDGAETQVLYSFANAFIMMAFVATMTCILVLLYKFRFYKVIYGWLFLSTLMLLSLFSIIYVQELLKHYNLAADYPAVLFVIWNWACFGIICIHWRGPLIFQQIYLISMAALMALIFIKYLPEWTVWTVLGALAVWDLVAVLCPHGPLRVLVETVQKRNEPLFPALIYSSGVAYTMVATTEDNLEDKGAETGNDNHPPQPATRTANSSDGGSGGSFASATSESSTAVLVVSLSTETAKPGGRLRNAPGRVVGQQLTDAETTMVPVIAALPGGGDTVTIIRSRSVPPVDSNVYDVHPQNEGVKLGLGDFIFYSVLVGKASSYGDWNTTLACYIAILVGLAFTLMLLAICRHALPALPISIFAGIVFFFATRAVITPFTTVVSMHQFML